MKKVILNIGGMHCASCSAFVQRALKKTDGVHDVSVNLALQTAAVAYADEERVENLIIAVEKAGYTASIAENENLFEKKVSDEVKKLQIRFMFSFALSLPVFILGMFFMHEPVKFQNEIMMVLAAGVQFIIAAPLYKSAFFALKSWNANMDTLVVTGTSAAYFYSVYAVFYGGHVYFEASAVLITIVLLGRILEERAKMQTSEAISHLINLRPKYATVIRGKEEFQVSVDDIQEGDIILVKPGESIAVDGIVVDGTTEIDESMITGESIPVLKKTGCEVTGATVNTTGAIRFRATRVGQNTTLARIIKTVKDAQSSRAPIQRFADRVSAWFVPVIILIAGFTFSGWMAAGYGLEFSLRAAVSVLVIACPCALGLATPTAIMVGTGIGAEAGILIKGGEALEILHRIKTVILDKTGTITTGLFEVTDIISISESPKSILSIAASLEKNSEHPLGKAIVKKAHEMQAEIYDAADFQSFSGMGVAGCVNGKQYFAGSRKIASECSAEMSANFANIEKLENEGKTVVIVGENRRILGMIALSDCIKEESVQAVSDLLKLGLKVYMLTGDNERAARVVAEKTGIKSYYASVSPSEKAEYVKKIRMDGPAAMVGDGINDAPAIASAEIGIAMGRGTDVALETGNVVLMRDNLGDIIRAIVLSRNTMHKIRQNMFWALFYNILGIPVAAGLLYPFSGMLLNPMIAAAAMTLSSVSVVTNSLLLKKKKI